MLTLTASKTLSPSLIFPFSKPKTLATSSPPLATSSPPSSSHHSTPTPTTTTNIQTERGLQFDVGPTFFRHESSTGRDLGVLAAALYKRSNPQLRALDAMCGCGVRSVRYMVQSGADFVVANDGNEENRGVIVSNLRRYSSSLGENNKRWVVTHFDANRLLNEFYLQRDFFDFIDVDSFGSDSSFLRSAFNALKLGGLVYVTSTDGYSAGGHRPHNSLASYGAYIRPMPYANEIGLRMLIGGAVRDASVMGYCVRPLFSYYSFHGPVFRVLLQVNRGKLDIRHYGFISYCHMCGNSQAYSWDDIAKIGCSCGAKPSSLVVSGPLWTGPLHDAAYLTQMLDLANEWGWIGNGVGLHLEKLIKLMIDESNPELPFGYTKLDEVASRAKVNSPPLLTMLSALHQEGFAACRSHIKSNAIKTNCSMTTCIKIMKDLQDHTLNRISEADFNL